MERVELVIARIVRQARSVTTGGVMGVQRGALIVVDEDLVQEALVRIRRPTRWRRPIHGVIKAAA
jgi:hypothetical protein